MKCKERINLSVILAIVLILVIKFGAYAYLNYEKFGFTKISQETTESNETSEELVKARLERAKAIQELEELKRENAILKESLERKHEESYHSALIEISDKAATKLSFSEYQELKKLIDKIYN